MPCHVVKTEPHFSQATPAKHNFCVHELLGHAEKENPASFGIMSMDGGNPVTYNKLPFHAFIGVIEGEAWVEDLDKQTGPVKLSTGDIVHVTVGTSLRWGTPTKGKAIYVHLKALGDPVFVQGLDEPCMLWLGSSVTPCGVGTFHSKGLESETLEGGLSRLYQSTQVIE